MKTKMAPDANFESMSNNHFTVNDNFLILKAIQIFTFILIFLLLTQNISIQMKFVKILNIFEKTVSLPCTYKYQEYK